MRASERTSLGCHTDLWNPHTGAFSSLVRDMGWSGLMPPLQAPADILGPVTPEVAAATGLDPATPVHCGIHDSNASLLPHLLARKPPFAVVSTGTWVVAMAIGGRRVAQLVTFAFVDHDELVLRVGAAQEHAIVTHVFPQRGAAWVDGGAGARPLVGRHAARRFARAFGDDRPDLLGAALQQARALALVFIRCAGAARI